MLLNVIQATLGGVLVSGAALALATCESRTENRSQAMAVPKAEDRLAVKAVGAYIFILAEGKSVYAVTDGARIDSITSLKARFGDAFLWFQHEGRAYVIKDPAILRKAQGVFDRSEVGQEARDPQAEGEEARLEAQLEQLDTRREALEEQRERLEEQEEALGSAAAPKAGEQTRIDAERQRLDQAEAALDREAEALEQAAEKLEQQREAAAERHEKALEAMEEQFQHLLAEAVKSGAAVPADDRIKKP